MIYYMCGSDLFSSQVAIGNYDFIEITEAQYNKLLGKAVEKRETGQPVNKSDDWI